MERTARHDHFIGIGNMVDDDRLGSSCFYVVAFHDGRAYNRTHYLNEAASRSVLATRPERLTDHLDTQEVSNMVADFSLPILAENPRYTILTSARAFQFQGRAS